MGKRAAGESSVSIRNGSRHVVGDARLDEERAANAATAPREAKEFVLGPEEAARQEDELIKRSDILSLHANFDRRMQTLEDSIERFNSTMASNNDNLTTSMRGAIRDNNDNLMSRLVSHCEQLSLKVVFAMQWRLKPLMDIAMGVRGAVRDTMNAAVMNVNSRLVQAFRSATKAPAKKKSTDSTKYPEDQLGTELQHTVKALGLVEVAHRLTPEMTYPGWKSTRASFGKEGLQERLRRNEMPASDPRHVAKPRLWTFAGKTVEGGGVRYLYLKGDDDAFLDAIWLAERPGGSFHQRAVRKSREAPFEEWPQHAAELEPTDVDYEE